MEELRRENERRLAALTRSLGTFGLEEVHDDERTIDEYTAELDRWSSRARSAAREQWQNEFAVAGYGSLVIRVTNLSEQFLSDVEVTVNFPQHDAKGMMDKPDAVRMPQRPRAYGEPTRADSALGRLLSGAGMLTPMHPILAHFDPPSISRTWVEDGSIKVTFDIGDLRPKRSDDSEEIWVFLPTRPEGGLLKGRWEASAREISGVAMGEIAIPVSESPIDIVSLLTED